MLPSVQRRLRGASAAAAAVLLAGADLVQDFIGWHWRQPLAPQGPPPAPFSPLEPRCIRSRPGPAIRRNSPIGARACPPRRAGPASSASSSRCGRAIRRRPTGVWPATRRSPSRARSSRWAASSERTPTTMRPSPARACRARARSSRPCCARRRPRRSADPAGARGRAPLAVHRFRARAAAELEAEGGAVGARVGRTREPGRIDADHLSVAHEIAPALDDFHLVAALAQRLANVVAEAILEPERARLLAPGTAEEPARRLDRRLRAEPSVDDAGDERGLRLRLALAAHRAVDEPRTSVDQVHGGDQRMRSLFARLQAVDVPRVERE